MAHKKLTVDNWTKPDPASQLFMRITTSDEAVPLTGPDWAGHFLAVELSSEVPHEIHELFATARGALLYGWFYYPLFRLGEEQLYRVAETAAKLRYRMAGGPEQRPTFSAAVEWLLDRKLIPETHEVRWTAIRQLRNVSSHPERQAAMPPGPVLGALRGVAEDISALFA